MTIDKNLAHRPKVSIICVTYNQEQYIAQAIDSFIMQATDFPVEIIIADDCSSDNTRAIISKYAKKYPTIHPVFNEKNLGVVGNFYKAIRLAKGQYIALCEGDDFWTDKDKIRKQASFLDAHESYSVCFHAVEVMIEGKISEQEYFPTTDDTNFSLRRLLEQNFIQTNSVMYRRQKEYPAIASDALPVDWYLHLYHAKQGKIGFINEPMAVYRRHKEGVWWKDDKNQIEFWQRNAVRHLRFFECVEALFADNNSYVSVIHQSIVELIDGICLEVGDHDNYQIATNIATTFPRYVAMAITHHVSQGVLPHTRIKELTDRLNLANNELSVAEQKNNDLSTQLNQTNEQLLNMKNSKSWRITKPLRALNRYHRH